MKFFEDEVQNAKFIKDNLMGASSTRILEDLLTRVPLGKNMRILDNKNPAFWQGFYMKIMKKISIIGLLLLALGCIGNNINFTPDMSLLTTWERSEITSNEHQQPYIAIFKKDGKTLIYLASKHNFGKTLDMVDYIYANFKPKVAVLEFESGGRMLKEKCSRNEFEYSAGIAADKNIPVVLSDLQDHDKLKIVAQINPDAYKIYQAKWIVSNAINYEKQYGGKTTAEQEVLNFKKFAWNDNMPEAMNVEQFKDWFKKHLGTDFDKANLSEIFKKDWRYPLSSGTVFNKFSEDEDILARDPFMLKNITAALNKYNTVYAAFGEGHYRSQRKVLEEMLGKPQYIWELEKYTDRNNCKGFKIKQEILVPNP